MNTLDNLLDELIHSINNNPETSNYVGAEDDKALARLRASLIDYIEQIIGEDEETDHQMSHRQGKAIQRAKLKGKE